MATLLRFLGLKVCGVPKPKPMHRFSPNFQGMFTPRGSRADLVFVHCHIFKSTFILHSFIEDIFTKFAENVYGFENMSVKNFVLILKDNMAAIADYSKIIMF